MLVLYMLIIITVACAETVANDVSVDMSYVTFVQTSKQGIERHLENEAPLPDEVTRVFRFLQDGDTHQATNMFPVVSSMGYADELPGVSSQQWSSIHYEMADAVFTAHEVQTNPDVLSISEHVYAWMQDCPDSIWIIEDSHLYLGLIFQERLTDKSPILIYLGAFAYPDYKTYLVQKYPKLISMPDFDVFEAEYMKGVADWMLSGRDLSHIGFEIDSFGHMGWKNKHAWNGTLLASYRELFVFAKHHSENLTCYYLGESPADFWARHLEPFGLALRIVPGLSGKLTEDVIAADELAWQQALRWAEELEKNNSIFGHLLRSRAMALYPILWRTNRDDVADRQAVLWAQMPGDRVLFVRMLHAHIYRGHEAQAMELFLEEKHRFSEEDRKFLYKCVRDISTIRLLVGRLLKSNKLQALSPSDMNLLYRLAGIGGIWPLVEQLEQDISAFQQNYGAGPTPKKENLNVMGQFWK